MNKKEKDIIPRHKEEDREREFWATHDSTEYIDWNDGEKLILPNLKPSLKTISLRVPESLIEELKLLANKKDIPYQSLLKVFLVERVEKELKNLSKKVV